MKIALVQLNATVGDVCGNTARIVQHVRAAREGGAQLVVFPEQAIIGYPAKDLLLRSEIVEGNLAALGEIAQAAENVAVVVGYAEPNRERRGRPLYNAAALVRDGRVVQRWRKRLLPIYDVFDEVRYFEPGGPHEVVDVNGLKVGVTICEDLWSNEEMMGHPLYECDPVDDVARSGAQLVLNISASPYFVDKHDIRTKLIGAHARRTGVPIAYVNQVGGNDEQLFDGASTVVNARGEVVGQARAFDEDVLWVDTDDVAATRIEVRHAGVADMHDALVMGLRDYVRKCGFTRAVIGLSGGIDSAVVAALAATALGAENVHGVAMPSRYSSAHSIADAQALAENLGVRFSTVPIDPMHARFEEQLAPHFENRPPDITEENIQARVRCVILMALSNKFGSLLLTTGNKSELAVGYCTLYGDMAGGLAVISDVPKTMVYALARHMNARAGRELIPESTLTKPPSAELKPDQTDQDSLPSYEELDGILQRYEERMESVDAIVAAGFERETVERVVRLIQVSEYKRQQAAPGLKVTSRAFGFGRRMPIAARHGG